MPATLCPRWPRHYRPIGVFVGLDPRGPEPAAHEARLVAAGVRLVELVLGERAGAKEEVELVAQVGVHHLVCRLLLEKKHTVLDQAAQPLTPPPLVPNPPRHHLRPAHR